MAKFGAAAVAATGVGGTGAAALGAYGMGYFGDGSGTATGNFTNPKHKQLISEGHVYNPISAPKEEQVPTTNSNN